MSFEYGFKFVQENCIECRGCEVACKSWRGVELGIHYRKVKRIWEGSYPKVSMRSVSVSCMHCADPDCVKACPEHAITKRPEDGIVVVDREKCVGCQACLENCTFGAPQFGKDERVQKCDMCVGVVDLSTEPPPCVSTCPTKALSVVQMEVDAKMNEEAAIRKMIAL